MAAHTERQSNYLDARIAYLCGSEADSMLRWAVGETWRYLAGEAWPRRIRYRTGLDVRDGSPIDEGLSKVREAWDRWGRFEYLNPVQKAVRRTFGVTPPREV
ncbi:MAG TPA: hypothetical protein VGR71_06185 [Nitrospira sp.]|nr:hypothetical protein [Nitrospira sp.]